MASTLSGSSRARFELRTIAMVVCFLLVVSAFSWRTTQHLHGPIKDDTARWGMIDFRDVIYFPTRAVWDGVNPYDSAETSDPTRYRGRYPVGNVFPLYSPLLLLMDWPLQLFPYHLAMAIYGLLNVGLVVLVALLSLRFSGVKASVFSTLIVATCMLLSRPGQSNFYYGQVALPMVVASMAAVYWAPSRPEWASVALALATIKPTFGGPLLILLFCQRQWKAAIGGAALGGGVALVGFALIFVYCDSGQPFWQVLQDNQRDLEADPGADPHQTGFRLDASAVIERAVGLEHGPLAKKLVAPCILAAGGFVLWLLSRNRTPPNLAWPVTPIFVTTLLCIYHCAYDALLLTWPIVSLAMGSVEVRESNLQRGLRRLVLCLMLVPAVNVFSSRQFFVTIARYLGREWTLDSNSWAWDAACMANGASLLAAWTVLLAAGLFSAFAARRPIAGG